MALLQISEPGQAPDPHQRRIAVGIDLGTTHSLVAALRHGHSVCLPDAQGRVFLPSVLRFLPAAAPHRSPSRQIGWEALQAQTQDPANTISSVKRLMGRTRADLQASGVLERLPYTVVDGAGMAAVRTVAGDKSPVEVSAEILALHGILRRVPWRFPPWSRRGRPYRTFRQTRRSPRSVWLLRCPYT